MGKKFETLKALNRSLSAYDKSFYVWYLLDIMISSIVPIFQLYITSIVIELLTQEVDFSIFVRELTWRMLILILIEGILTLVQGKLDLHGEIYRNSLIVKVFNLRLLMDYPLLLGSKATDLFNRASRTLDNRWEALNETINSSRRLITSVIATILYISILSQLHLIFFIAIVILVILLILIKIKQERVSTKIQPEKVDNQSKYNYLNTMMGDQRIAKDVRLYGMSPWFKEIHQGLKNHYRQIVQPQSRWSQIEGIIVIIFLALMSALAYHLSIQEIQNGQLSVADFVIYVSLVSMVTTTLTSLINSSAEFSQNLNKLQALNAYFNQEPVLNHHSDQKIGEAPYQIELKHVSYIYPNASSSIFEDLNLTINPNEKLAIVGENGAGKTTLVKLIMGLIQPDQGEVLLNGIDINEFAIEDYYDLFAPVFQDDALFTMTLKESILQGNEYVEEKYQQVIDDAGLKKLISELPQGEDTAIIRQIDPEAIQLSGGQIQRLKLAKALYKDTPILILDEPTSALDPLAESEVYQNYLTFAQDKTAIFISHRLASTQFCDRIIYLSHGKIKEVGSHQELMDLQGSYYHLFETQAYYYREDIEEEEEIQVGGLMI